MTAVCSRRAPRPGGRVFTVRRGTVSEEDGPAQTAAFDDGLYFNAGPMRISHHHQHDVGVLPRAAGAGGGVRGGL